MRRMSWRIAAVIFLCAGSGFAAIPQTISYQGVLADTSGPNVMDGTYSITFRLWAAPTGGSALWTETQDVGVVDGRFNVLLGSVTPFNLSFDDPYYLGVQVESDPEMEPRTPLASAPYALNAAGPDPTGVASARVATTFSFSGAGTVIISRSIDVPGPGYVHAIGTGSIQVPALDTASFLLRPQGSGNGQNIRVSSATSQNHLPLCVQAVFPVASAGTFTYEIFASLSSGFMNSTTANDVALTLVYIPVAYGTVSSP